MTRGKYAAKAANRMAQLDSELVNELRRELAAATHERDVARRDLEQLTRSMEVQARRLGSELAGAEILDLRRQLLDEKAARAADRERFADEVFDVFRKHGGELPAHGYLELADIFGASSKFGMYLTGGNGNRNQRRVNGRTARLVMDKVAIDSDREAGA